MNTVVIIPTYNEAKNIAKIIDSVNSLKIKNLKILVVDDSSPDGTAKIAKDKGVNLLINKKKQGLGHAYLKGMEYAIKHMDVNLFIQMDADFSHDPNDIPKFIKKINQGYDFVIGSRYVKGGSIPSNWGIHRKLISKLGNKFIGLFLGKDISDWSTGYRAIKKKVYQKLKDNLTEDMFQGYTYQIGFLDNAIKNNFKIGKIPIHFKNREHGISKFGSEYFINTLKYLLSSKIK
jgi:dolichol-phosphate mannosyltransferase